LCFYFIVNYWWLVSVEGCDSNKCILPIHAIPEVAQPVASDPILAKLWQEAFGGVYRRYHARSQKVHTFGKIEIFMVFTKIGQMARMS
jgi:hypothetical protein